MKNKTLIEIVGISGVGKSTYLRKLQEIYKSNNEFKEQKNISRSKTLFILKTIINSPRDILFLIMIFDYFLDDTHKKNLITYFNRFIKIYKVFIFSRFNRIKFCDLLIQESIVHLSINVNKKSSKKFIEIIKKLYCVEKIYLIYLDLDVETALRRMHSRGDDLKNCYELRRVRYNLASDFHKLLLKEIDNLTKRNYSNLILNSKLDIESNLISLNTWLHSKAAED